MRFSGLGVSLLLLTVSIACDDKKSDGGNSAVCDANKTVDCGDVPVAEVSNQRFVAGLGTATCASDGSAWDTSACTRIGGGAELSVCVGSGQGDCDSGLTCVATGTNQSQCLPACDASGGCTANHVCVKWSDTESYCFENATTADQCYATVQCTATGDECQITAYDSAKEVYGGCTRECTGAQIGRAGGTTGNNCTAAETCASNPLFFEYQKSGANNVACDPTATTDSCDIASGYTCQSDAPSNGQNSCARYSGNCLPNVLPLIATATEINASLNVIDNGDYTNLCFTPVGGNGDGYLGEIYVGGYGCGLTGVTGVPAQTLCARYTLSSDTAVTGFGYCVGFCEGPNDTTLDCGTGYHCDRPAIADALYIESQLNGTATVSCTGATDTTSCDASGGYACVTAASGDQICARPRQLCLKN